MLHSYPSIFNMGHKAITELLKSPVYVQEKVDGSQFSFGIGDDGELYARSKGCSLNLAAYHNGIRMNYLRGNSMKNRAKCRKCKQVIESKYRHDFVTCKCGAISVDGGNDYHKRVGYPADFIEVTDEH